MKKTLDYLYIFSKLSTSFILLLCVLVLMYFFYLSFNNQRNLDSEQGKFINILIENSEQLLILSEKIQTTDSSLENIQNFLNNSNDKSISKEIDLLNTKIADLSLELQNIVVNLQEIQSSKITNKKNIVKENRSNPSIDTNKLELGKLILFKFENNLDFNEDLLILQSLNNENKQYIFEKINLNNYQNYRGSIFLKNLFEQELDVFLKNSINDVSNNFIKDSFMKFIIIEPSKKNTIKNNEVNYLKEIKSFIDQKKYKNSYKKIKNIKNYQNFFSDTVSQLTIVIEFKELIQMVS